MSKKSIAMICIAAVTLMLSGCASQEAYKAYTDAIVKANSYRQSPGMVQEFDSQGRLVKQSIIMPDQPVQVAQIKDSEWASPISMAMSLGMFGLGNWAVSHEWAGAMKSVQPNITTNTTAGGHLAGGDVSTPTTTNTTTITNPEPVVETK